MKKISVETELAFFKRIKRNKWARYISVLKRSWRRACLRYNARKKVFVLGSLTHSRLAQPYIRFVNEFLKERGYEVLSDHNGADQPVKNFLETIGSSERHDVETLHNLFRDNDNRWIRECGFLVAELSQPSLGVGGEWENCRLKPELGSFVTPMLGIYQDGSKVSPYITGIAEYEREYIWFRPYKTKDDLVRILTQFLKEFT